MYECKDNFIDVLFRRSRRMKSTSPVRNSTSWSSSRSLSTNCGAALAGRWTSSRTQGIDLSCRVPGDCRWPLCSRRCADVIVELTITMMTVYRHPTKITSLWRCQPSAWLMSWMMPSTVDDVIRSLVDPAVYLRRVGGPREGGRAGQV